MLLSYDIVVSVLLLLLNHSSHFWRYIYLLTHILALSSVVYSGHITFSNKQKLVIWCEVISKSTLLCFLSRSSSVILKNPIVCYQYSVSLPLCLRRSLYWMNLNRVHMNVSCFQTCVNTAGNLPGGFTASKWAFAFRWSRFFRSGSYIRF